ncbi:MAG: NAD-glutamate dehydrogenase [Alphaproteobacteria bacterium]|nr:NAD-glutamate dehydrogenase [Alphaproteobacteria bacterium]
MSDIIDLNLLAPAKNADVRTGGDKPDPLGEARKARVICKAAQLCEAGLVPAEHAPAATVIAKFYEHVPPGDVAERAPRDLGGAALALWRFAGRRRLGQAKIRVYNPESDVDGWASPHTVVEVVNDDMPFLVDSVTAAINAGDRVVRLVIHPILTVDRDAAGRLREIRDSTEAGLRESWMQIEITREPDPTGLARLTDELSRVLADVRAAVEGWQDMRRTLRAIRDALTRPPAPPVPAHELAEVQDFLRWLDDDNFTFLGFREYLFNGVGQTPRPALGMLADPDYRIFDGLRDLSSLPADVQDFIRRRELLIVTKSNRRATVHRAVHMDAIGIRRFDAGGAVVGIRLFLGLFTSTAYSRSPRAIPLLRRKVHYIVERSGLSPVSHDGKALAHILDTFPRDELFQGSEEELFDTVVGILNLQERQRIALFVRRDPLERFVSCLVFAPRERYDSDLRRRFATILERSFAGRLSAFYTHLDDSVLARIHFIIRTTRGQVPAVDPAALERELAEAGRNWSDHLEEEATATFGEAEGRTRLRRLEPFPVAYQALTRTTQAIADLPRIEKVLAGSPLEVSLHSVAESGRAGLRLYRAKEPAVLSDILPMLENLGLRVVAEEPFRIDSVAGDAVWIHEFHIANEIPVTDAVQQRFEEALVALWTGRVENDGFSRLVLAAGLTTQQIGLLRLYAKVLRQAGSAFSQAYMEDTLSAHPDIAARLVRLFEIRFDPAAPANRGLAVMGEVQAIDHALDRVASLDEDRILRSYLTLILKSVRTNYFQRLPSGNPKPYLAVKLASSEIDLLPVPRPLFEIYVSSPRMEGVHMRAGMVARGGIRWSDRREDFRTEILGLMKAQTVKNTVIVPVGAKGGFVVKQPARDDLGAEAIECYKILIRALLDLTDNIIVNDADGHRIVPPPDVVRHDGDDPYLVVAADKGTATFSDYANAIAEEYGFWLGDAFASGGSTGYDHKEMGITARGAWELVKRHFRELGRDIETSEITVVGVGDMSGDVFGNGMLMSRKLRLLGAFDHRHVFIDPDPDPALSFAERQRLFRLPRSNWADYDPQLISQGGGVFDRVAKSVAISPQIKRVFGVEADRLTPGELIRKLLCAPVDLLWFGGIGTFVKAHYERHAEVGDRSNDAVRIDSNKIRAMVVGEGANLGVTQRGRIAYALAGGRIDTDAVDNSAGVDTSDHEVNLKILIDRAIASQKLPAAEREPLLHGMTEDVASLVLRDNYRQGEALSLAEARGVAALDRQIRLMRELEKSGRLDRGLEFLPDDETVANRAVQRRGLTRPELAVLLAYSKMALDAELLASDLPDALELAEELLGYFPRRLRERLGPQIPTHPLRREIVATIVTNDLVNRAGITFVSDLRARTARSAPEIARAYLIVREILYLPRRWAEIEALDNRVTASLQTEMLLEIASVVEHAAAWLLRNNRLGVGTETARLGPGVHHLAGVIPQLLPAGEQALFDERVARFAAAGAPAAVAADAGATVFLTTALEVAASAERTAQPIERAAQVFYGVGARFALDELRAAARRLRAESGWQKLAAECLIDDFYDAQANLAERVLASEHAAEPDPISAWANTWGSALAPAKAIAGELRAADAPNLAMLVVAARQLRQALG